MLKGLRGHLRERGCTFKETYYKAWSEFLLWREGKVRAVPHTTLSPCPRPSPQEKSTGEMSKIDFQALQMRRHAAPFPMSCAAELAQIAAACSPTMSSSVGEQAPAAFVQRGAERVRILQSCQPYDGTVGQVENRGKWWMRRGMAARAWEVGGWGSRSLESYIYYQFQNRKIERCSHGYTKDPVVLSECFLRGKSLFIAMMVNPLRSAAMMREDCARGALWHGASLATRPPGNSPRIAHALAAQPGVCPCD